jgi:hypothetical protein
MAEVRVSSVDVTRGADGTVLLSVAMSPLGSGLPIPDPDRLPVDVARAVGRWFGHVPDVGVPRAG